MTSSRIYGISLGILLAFALVSLTLVSSAYYGGNNFGSSNTGGFTSATNSWQSYQPTFDQLYSGDARNIWPILNDIENGQCNATQSDFIIGIPPGGCSPAVVRSDLLEEQNVPVFCQLYAIKVNPLIKVSSIRTISFNGDYPEGVSGISFHPARAATRSYRTLLGDPVSNNIGYVVIILKGGQIEENMEEWIAGNLTARIRYDADEAYGAGRSEYYLDSLSDDEWDARYAQSSFFAGRGYVRLLSDFNTGNRFGGTKGEATVGVYGSKNQLLSQVTLQEGETSRILYLPGYYCRAGFKVKLNRFVAPEDSALINVDGNEFWVREGSRFLNDQCVVRDIDLDKDDKKESDAEKVEGTEESSYPIGSISIRCAGSSFELALSESSTQQELQDATHGAIDEYYSFGEDTVEELIRDYRSETKPGGREAYGEEALYEQILLAAQLGKQKSQLRLIDLFLEQYPNSQIRDKILEDKRRLGSIDYSKATTSAFVTDEFHTIGLVDFDPQSGGENVGFEVEYNGQKRAFKKGEPIKLSDKIQVKASNIYVNDVRFNFVKGKPRDQSYSFTLNKNEDINIDGLEFKLTDIIGLKDPVAHIEIVPEVRRTETEADFTFKIGVEKRAIQLSTEKTEELIENINASIEKWENINNRLGDLITVWKGACFATSGYLTVKNLVSGFDGESLARQKVMDRYKQVCAQQHGDLSSTQCYQKLSEDIDRDVASMQERLNGVNEIIESCEEGNVESSGIFGGNHIINQETHLSCLRDKLGSDWKATIDGQEVTAADLYTTTQLRTALLNKDVTGFDTGNNVDFASMQELNQTLRNVAYLKKNKASVIQAQQSVQGFFKDGVAADVVVSRASSDNVEAWGGKKYGNLQVTPTGESFESDKPIQIFKHSDGLNYLLILGGAGTGNALGVEKAYRQSSSGSSWTPVTEKKLLRSLQQTTFVGSGLSGSCSEPWPAGSAKVHYYESGQNKGLPAIVPFDREGWYALVPNSAGTFLDDSPRGYTASADVEYFQICSIGPNRVMETGKGDDLCQSFNANTVGTVDRFLPCRSLDEGDVRELYLNAREAIRQASQQYAQGQRSISIRNGKGDILDAAVGAPMSEIGGFECEDFMSPSDCKLLYNVCDPVICPSSRCDLGGKLPVADVIQTGVVGGVLMCLPNADEVAVPLCLSGIHAGLDSFVSLLKSEEACLQENLETGRTVGICDEITSIYKCEFFWRQVAPVTELIVPKAVESLYGGGQSTRGGGEYLSIQNAWQNAQKSVSFFRDEYAASTFRAFNLRSVEEAGGEFCQAFIGSSFPTSGDAIERLLQPDSPTQFYAQFDEIEFSDATLPATSQYKVYFHIYAGNDHGSNFRVYLKNPPASSYYRNNPILQVKSGYITRGNFADETIDFTAPSGYKELCVVIDSQEMCGFKQVSTELGVKYLGAKYVEDQANREDITTEKECVSGSPSAFSLASLNLGEAVNEIANPDISLRGITRVCATNSPETGFSTGNNVYCGSSVENRCGRGYSCATSGYCEDSEGNRQTEGQRWLDVGYCGDVNLRCWLDVSSVEDDLGLVEAIEGTNLEVLDKQRGLLENTKLTLEQVREVLASLAQRIKNLRSSDVALPLSRDGAVADIQGELDTVIGNDSQPGSGTNADRAEALSLRATIYRLIVLGNLEKDARSTRPPQVESRPADDTEGSIDDSSDDSGDSSSGDTGTGSGSGGDAVTGGAVDDIDLLVATMNSFQKGSRSCDCGDNCRKYAGNLIKYSLEENFDPLLSLAVMIQESDCQFDATSGSSYGLMQIEGTTFEEICKGKLESGNANFLNMRTSEAHVDENIECGLKILRSKYDAFGDGAKESWAYKTSSSQGGFSSGVRSCIDNQAGYADYRGVDAALRGYNGWGCTPPGADVDYVENVNELYLELQNIYFGE